MNIPTTRAVIEVAKDTRSTALAERTVDAAALAGLVPLVVEWASVDADRARVNVDSSAIESSLER